MTLSSRHTDPETSREAAKAHAEKAKSHRAKLLDAVQKNNGCTSGEAAALAGLDRVEAARRMPELERAKRIARGLPRTCEVCKTSQMTWWITKGN